MTPRTNASNNNQLEEIAAGVRALIDNPNATLARDAVLRFGNSPNLQVLGSLAYLLLRTDLAMRIVPPLSVSGRQDLLLKYWTRCLIENPADNEFVGGRYVSAGEVLGWFTSLWQDKSVDRDVLTGIKRWLGDIYRKGGDEVRTCIVQAVLEHLLQSRDVRDFFSDWKKDPFLGVPYKEATE